MLDFQLPRFAQLHLVMHLAFSRFASASWQILAHRGVFHDKLEVYCTTENSFDAHTRAFQFDGVSGVEIDVKVTHDGQLIAFHDPNANALTVKDNLGGKMSALSVALGHQKEPKPVPIREHSAKYLLGTPMKIYGKGGHLITAESKPKLESLETILTAMKQAPTSFKITLDVTTPYIADHSAALIRKLGMQNRVYMKIWASKALISTGPKYNGANTCYEYARSHGWGGIMIIPEINEVQLAKGTNKVAAFGGHLDVGAYLDCWASAQKDHAGNGAALMPMVSAMLPNFDNPQAVQAANQAFDWAEKNKRPKVSVIVMPDFCSYSTGRGGGRKAWRIKDGISAFIQPRAQVDKRRGFCDQRADYCVVDVLGDFENFHVTADYDDYMNGICPA